MPTTDSASRGEAGTSPPALAWIVPVLAFLAGCLLSGIAVALVMSDGDDEDPVVAAPTATSSTTPDPEATAPSPEVVVRVPQACLDAADSALEAGQEAEDVVAAVRDLDARRLQEIVDRFQQNEPALRQAAQRCRDTTDQRVEDGLVVTPAPTPPG